MYQDASSQSSLLAEGLKVQFENSIIKQMSMKVRLNKLLFAFAHQVDSSTAAIIFLVAWRFLDGS